jgi:UDP-GlcNAc:undecaprenyl-phosphate GlcNAc-1-phosphate transferase
MHFGGTVLRSFGDLFSLGQLQTGLFAWVVTIFCVSGVINAINMIDGLDGLAGSVSLVAFIAFGMLSGLLGRNDLVLVAIAFSGAIAAFLYFNWHPAKLFMGDAGSMNIGFVLAYLSIETTQHSHSVSPVVALLILALPVSDTLVVMARRMFAGKNPFHADRTHIHHLLLEIGFSQRATVLIITMLTVVSSSIAVIGTIQHVSEPVLFTIWISCFALYFAACCRIEIIYRFICHFRAQSLSSTSLDASKH